jgi:uncharacterized membrane protein YeaQ/YmgE (transglycosylase-associated protein family)
MLSFLWMCIIGLITMVLGIAGALIAGFLGRALGWYQPGEGAGLIMSVLGAILLLAVYRMMSRRSTAI